MNRATIYRSSGGFARKAREKRRKGHKSMRLLRAQLSAAFEKSRGTMRAHPPAPPHLATPAANYTRDSDRVLPQTSWKCLSNTRATSAALGFWVCENERVSFYTVISTASWIITVSDWNFPTPRAPGFQITKLPRLRFTCHKFSKSPHLRACVCVYVCVFPWHLLLDVGTFAWD